MTYFTLRIRAEAPEDFASVEQLGAEAFGPGRFARAAFRLREGVAHEAGLSFVALMKNGSGVEELVGSVRLTRILIGCRPALVLGPLVVARSRKNLGIGRELMNRALHAAREQGHRLVILVGDQPYYARFGFRPVPAGRITLPGPADPARILYLELEPGALVDHAGAARKHA
ncbi:MAG: N-acetyltransferase [Alphaproteobacteria bacterium]|nr:MAG: N-acetyltransferase [Alphaproteobacteria bacterium]